MPTTLPEFEGWIKAAGALVAVLMAVLVPIRSWLVEDRRFRAQTLEAIASASRHAVAGVSASPTMLADTLALSALAESLNRLAAAIERLLDREVGQDRDRLTRAVERFTERFGTGS